MITVNIPLVDGAPLPFFDMQLALEGVTYTLQFRWNVRLEAWFLDVLDEAASEYLIAGLRLVVNWPLTAYRDTTVPPGQFLVLDSTGSDTDPALNDLGTRVKILYLMSTELGL